jgi:hypothetical protein
LQIDENKLKKDPKSTELQRDVTRDKQTVKTDQQQLTQAEHNPATKTDEQKLQADERALRAAENKLKGEEPPMGLGWGYPPVWMFDPMAMNYSMSQPLSFYMFSPPEWWEGGDFPMSGAGTTIL